MSTKSLFMKENPDTYIRFVYLIQYNLMFFVHPIPSFSHYDFFSKKSQTHFVRLVSPNPVLSTKFSPNSKKKLNTPLLRSQHTMRQSTLQRYSLDIRLYPLSGYFKSFCKLCFESLLNYPTKNSVLSSSS